MTEKKKEIVKNLLINTGVFLVLVGATAVKGEHLSFFLVGMVLLALQTLEIRGDAKKPVIAEIMLSAVLLVGAVTQLLMARSFGTAQVFLVVLLLGAVLIIVESLRKYADL